MKNKKKQTKIKASPSKFNQWFLAFGVIVITCIVFLPAFDNDFTNWDDPGYILINKYITSLSWENIRQNFVLFYMGNYHPLSILSTAVEYHFAGLDPGVYHRTNIILHLLNTFLVFRFILLLTQKNEIAFIVTILFGIHPMHVESVAWISERKDLLYSFFFLSSLLLYLQYKKTSLKIHYLFSILLFILSLLSKGQAVVLPVILVLVDYFEGRPMLNRKNYVEKFPFFILSVVFGIVAILAQRSLGAVNELDLNAGKSFFFGWYGLLLYIFKSVVPYQLSGFYPYPFNDDGSLPIYVYAAPVVLIFLGIVLWKRARGNRPVVFGILFFLACIFPVLQFLPVGKVVIADRYTYISYIGLFFILGYIFSFIKNKQSPWTNRLRPYISYILGSAIIFYSFVSYARSKVWHDSITFWSDVIEKYPDCITAYKARTIAYSDYEQYQNALHDCEKRIQLDPQDADAFLKKGMLFTKINQIDSSITNLNIAASMDSMNTGVFFSRGESYFNKKMYDESVLDYQRSIMLDSNNMKSYINLGIIYTDYLSRYQDGISVFQRALKIDSLNIEVIINLGVAYYKNGNYPEAISQYDKSLRLSPDNSRAIYLLSLAYAANGNPAAAYQEAIKARQLGYNVEESYLNQLQWSAN